MQPLAFKMLFRKKGTASAILAVALLVALLASVNSLVNNINAQTSVTSELATIGRTYLVTSSGSTSLLDSQVNPTVLNLIQSNSNVSYATGQQLTEATLMAPSGNFSVDVLGVSNLQSYLSNNHASINGSVAKNPAETDVGVILANLASIHKGNSITVALNGEAYQLTVAGVTQTSKQSDTELVMPLQTLQSLTGSSGAVSYIEFSLKSSAEANMTIAGISQALPSGLKVTQVQQVQTFAQNINGQTAAFVSTWSIAVYIVMAAAAYIITSRLLDESKFELFMLRTMGAKKTSTVSLIVAYTLVIAVLSSIVGLALGIVGTQIAATGVRWLWGSLTLAPFLQLPQTVEIILLTLAACLVGCVYPALKTTQKTTLENQQ